MRRSEFFDQGPEPDRVSQCYLRNRELRELNSRGKGCRRRFGHLALTALGRPVHGETRVPTQGGRLSPPLDVSPRHGYPQANPR